MIKKFENFETEESKDKKYTKILAHLATYLFNYGYEFSGNEYNIGITKNGIYIFAIVIRDLIDYSNIDWCFCFKNSSNSLTTDDICKQLVEHLKVIDGLKYFKYYDGSFTITGDVDNILKQIKVFFDMKKYNL